MLAIFNFQYGDFYNSQPGWYDWILLILTGLSSLGIIAGFILYNIQRSDTAKDAYELFYDGLVILDKAVEETIPELGKFEQSLKSENDNFKNPIFSASLGDNFFEKVDITALKRYAKKNRKKSELDIKNFLARLGFIGKVYQSFFDETNYFRLTFLSKEATFLQYRLLLANKLTEIVNANYEGRSAEFVQAYLQLVKSTFDNKNIVEDGILKNRTLLNKEFIIPLINISSKYSADKMANEINQMANEVNAARNDIDSLKANMTGFIAKNIGILKEVSVLVKAILTGYK